MRARIVLVLAGLLASQHAALADLAKESALSSSAEILSAAEPRRNAPSPLNVFSKPEPSRCKTFLATQYQQRNASSSASPT
jgi:hypothetical protein